MTETKTTKTTTKNDLSPETQPFSWYDLLTRIIYLSIFGSVAILVAEIAFKEGWKIGLFKWKPEIFALLLLVTTAFLFFYIRILSFILGELFNFLVWSCENFVILINKPFDGLYYQRLKDKKGFTDLTTDEFIKIRNETIRTDNLYTSMQINSFFGILVVVSFFLTVFVIIIGTLGGANSQYVNTVVELFIILFGVAVFFYSLLYWNSITYIDEEQRDFDVYREREKEYLEKKQKEEKIILSYEPETKGEKIDLLKIEVEDLKIRGYEKEEELKKLFSDK